MEFLDNRLTPPRAGFRAFGGNLYKGNQSRGRMAGFTVALNFAGSGCKPGERVHVSVSGVQRGDDYTFYEGMLAQDLRYTAASEAASWCHLVMELRRSSVSELV